MASSQSPQKKTERPPSSPAKKSDNPKNADSKRTLTLTEQITKLHESFKNQRKEHRKSVRSDIVKAVDIGLALKKNKKEWAYFCENSWKEGGPKVGQIEQAVRYAIKYMVGPGSSAQKKASFYYNAVAMAVADGLHGNKLKKLMKEKGLKTLAQEYAHHKKKTSANNAENANTAELPTKNCESKKAVNDDEVNSRPEEDQRHSNSREEKLKEDKHEWRSILRFEKSSDRLTNIKVGQAVRIRAAVQAAGPTLILAVERVKVKTDQN